MNEAQAEVVEQARIELAAQKEQLTKDIAAQKANVAYLETVLADIGTKLDALNAPDEIEGVPV